MDASDVGGLLIEGFLLAATLALPLVGAAFLAGVVSAVVQRLCSVSEPVIGLVPRLLGVGFALVLLAPWIAEQVQSYAERVLASLSAVGN
jgi:flagellar biosynthesis protein FliQ